MMDGKKSSMRWSLIFFKKLPLEKWLDLPTLYSAHVFSTPTLCIYDGGMVEVWSNYTKNIIELSIMIYPERPPIPFHADTWSTVLCPGDLHFDRWDCLQDLQAWAFLDSEAWKKKQHVSITPGVPGASLTKSKNQRSWPYQGNPSWNFMNALNVKVDGIWRQSWTVGCASNHGDRFYPLHFSSVFPYTIVSKFVLSHFGFLENERPRGCYWLSWLRNIQGLMS